MTPDTITFELPLSSLAEEKRGITVDALFTALDHAKAYHGHEGQYNDIYENLEEYLWNQASEQLTEK